MAVNGTLHMQYIHIPQIGTWLVIYFLIEFDFSMLVS